MNDQHDDRELYLLGPGPARVDHHGHAERCRALIRATRNTKTSVRGAATTRTPANAAR
jgi:hypothetical protein